MVNFHVPCWCVIIYINTQRHSHICKYDYRRRIQAIYMLGIQACPCLSRNMVGQVCLWSNCHFRDEQRKVYEPNKNVKPDKNAKAHKLCQKRMDPLSVITCWHKYECTCLPTHLTLMQLRVESDQVII